MAANHNKKKAIVRPDQSIEATSFEGIMPDPETLEHLNKIVPGAAQKWMDLAESEIKSRQINESRITWTFKVSTILGQLLGFVTSLVIAACGLVFAFYCDSPKSGAAVMVGSMASVIAAYYFRSKTNK